MDWELHSFAIGRNEHKNKVKEIVNELKVEFEAIKVDTLNKS
jgi:hypothetical protein